MSTNSITVFTTGTCQQCRMTEKHMTKNGLSFRIIRLENEPTIAAKLRSMGFMQAPIVQITGEQAQIWSGFRPDLIDSLSAT